MPLTKLCVEGSTAEPRATDLTQPAVHTTGLALVSALAGLGEFTVRTVAGLLGEKSARRLPFHPLATLSPQQFWRTS